jgi:hypothetical protein
MLNRNVKILSQRDQIPQHSKNKESEYKVSIFQKNRQLMIANEAYFQLPEVKNSNF